jgi:hypothetical protein
MGHNQPWDRDKLYAEVWAEPLIKVAKRYNMSDVAIAKACRKLKIPLPGRGYWARMAAGQKVAQEPLPNATDIPIVEHTVNDPAPADKGDDFEGFIAPEKAAEFLSIERRHLICGIPGEQRSGRMRSANQIFKDVSRRE